MTTLELVLLDPSAESAERMAGAMNAAGIATRVVRTAPTLARELRERSPDLLLIHGELGSPAVSEALKLVTQDAGLARLPIAMLGHAIGDARFVAQLRTGVVELLQEPFTPRLHIGRLRTLFDELRDRTGVYRGKGPGTDLAAFLLHAQRSMRTGSLSVATPARETGTVSIVRGAFKAAEYLGKAGAVAVAALVQLPQASWTFSRPGEAPGGNHGVVIEIDDLPEGEETLELTSVVEQVPGQGQMAREVAQPVRAEEAPAAARPEASTPKPSTSPLPAAAEGVAPPAPAVRPHLLLVDDDLDLRRMFSAFFAKRGYPVSSAGDGLEAMGQAVTGQFGLVVADLNMPRMDGWAFLRLLRDDYRTREVPVALFSCHDDYREALRAMHAGAQAFYPKSIRLDALETQLREVLEPRERFRRIVASRQSVAVEFGGLGPQWVLRTLVSAGFSGQLDAVDGWATFRLEITEGLLVSASARSGQHEAAGERALTAFIGSRAAQGSLAFHEGAVTTVPGAPLEPLLERAVSLLNENQRRVAEALKAATRFDVHPELSRLYSQVGPPHLHEAARLLCDERCSPAEVAARAGLTGPDVDELVKDLVRRGVIAPKT